MEWIKLSCEHKAVSRNCSESHNEMSVCVFSSVRVCVWVFVLTTAVHVGVLVSKATIDRSSSSRSRRKLADCWRCRRLLPPPVVAVNLTANNYTHTGAHTSCRLSHTHTHTHRHSQSNSGKTAAGPCHLRLHANTYAHIYTNRATHRALLSL